MPARDPYHAGEIEVQERVAVRAMAERIGRSIRAEIPPVAAEFLAGQRFAVLGWADGDGRVWASAVAGEPGILQAAPSGAVLVRAAPAAGDPLGAASAGEMGLLAIDLAGRRRMRVNGWMSPVPGGFEIHPHQVYANCPKYIQAREQVAGPARPGDAALSSSLVSAQADLIARADTFFIASYHPEGGADASHRGGAPGFVRVQDGGLSWPDYKGNSMFQTLGNIAADGRAGLLFVDFDTGSTLQLSGSAAISWDGERRVEFRVERVVEIASALPLRWRFIDHSPFNPA
ncbi:MAG TPA: pyridoxamine 5'-phosphate oxidase family protein [Kofleriaceae bacterium]|nr:pyridoxamine 5'-phosphate oxidase family protein [Kofleriaceae bacterium]